MSVFTAIHFDALQRLLHGYDVGTLLHFEGIEEGVENSNYFIKTALGEFVFTIFETLAQRQLDYYFDLMTYLSLRGVPCVTPLVDGKANRIQTYDGKPCAFFHRIKGSSRFNPQKEECQQIGGILAQLHLTGLAFPRYSEHRRGMSWRETAFRALSPQLNEDDRRLIRTQLAKFNHADLSRLPSGVIHADLFRDNVLFHGDNISGLLDFYFAGNDYFLYDVAVAVNDWCSDESGHLMQPCLQALLDGYQSVRRLTHQEKQHWPLLARIAAMRFWLSRLYAQHFPRHGEVTQIKDAQCYKRILIDRIENPINLLA